MYEGRTLVSVSSLHRLLRMLRVMQAVMIGQSVVMIALLFRAAQ